MPDRLLYATPTGKHPHPGYISSARQLEMTCKTFPRAVHDFLFAAGPVQMARSTIAEHAMRGVCYQDHEHAGPDGREAKGCKREPYDYLLMHDDDLVINPSGVGNPLDAWHQLFAAHPDVGVVGAVYLRERPQIPTVVMSHPEFPEENCHVVSGLLPRPTEVSGIGTGFMMIRVSAMRALADAEDGAHTMFQFPFKRTRWGVVNNTGEDYDFCARMRGAGYKVLADARWETAHLKDSGALLYRQADWEAQWDDSAPGIKERCLALRAQCQERMQLKMINGVLCIDHVPQLQWEGEQRDAERAQRAALKLVEAA